jgi:hypothetical protein
VIVAMVIMVVTVSVIVMAAAMIIVVVALAVVVVVFVLAVVVAIVVPNFVVVLISAKLMFPAAMTSPVGVFAAGRVRPTIAEMRIVVMVDVAMKTNWATEPRTSTDEDATGEPLRTVITEGRALIGSVVEISVWANRRDTDADGDLRGSFLRRRAETESSESGQNQNPKQLH